MIVVVDTTALTLLINPPANPPTDPSTGKRVTFAKERIEGLITSLRGTDTLVIPTPVLAEVLVQAEDGGPGILEQLNTLARVRIRPFDEKAAIEVAYMTREAIAAGDKRGGSLQPWQKVKFDRQIIAIARTNNATKMYADDRDLCAFAKALGIDVSSTWDLPVPAAEETLFTAAGLPHDTGRKLDL